MTTSSHSITCTCQWCSKPLIGLQRFQHCKAHIICDQCVIKNRSSQSACPCCWYENGTAFVLKNNICPVCCKPMKSDPNSPLCSNKHKYCSQCSPSGCKLCEFLQLRSYGPFENLSSNIQPSIMECEVWEKNFEKSQQMSSNNFDPNYNRQDSSYMDVDDYPVIVEDSNTPVTTNAQTTTSNNCVICFDNLDTTCITLPTCHHSFHKDCIEQWFQSNGKQTCPTCGHLYGINKGPRPSHGEMTVKYISTRLPGFSTESYTINEAPTIEIIYTIPSGLQGPLNPCPGQPYTGTVRRAYLPNNQDGKYVLNLLQRAFNDQHVFTIGTSVTTGQDNVVTWNDIHHKTSIDGGSENFGYPDPTYMIRIRQELADKGYK